MLGWVCVGDTFPEQAPAWPGPQELTSPPLPSPHFSREKGRSQRQLTGSRGEIMCAEWTRPTHGRLAGLGWAKDRSGGPAATFTPLVSPAPSTLPTGYPGRAGDTGGNFQLFVWNPGLDQDAKFCPQAILGQPPAMLWHGTPKAQAHLGTPQAHTHQLSLVSQEKGNWDVCPLKQTPKQTPLPSPPVVCSGAGHPSPWMPFRVPFPSNSNIFLGSRVKSWG